MTQEDKELLLKDLCARLPSGIKVRICDDFDSNIEILTEVDIEENRINGEIDTFYCIDNIKPYLRSLYNMTEEERKELELLVAIEVDNAKNEDEDASEWCLYDKTGILNARGGARFYFNEMIHVYDWLYQHHFDFRGLIEKGLALEAPEGMYK